MITKNEKGIRIIEPAEGLWLTNGEVWSKKVYLAANADPAVWTETAEEPPAPVYPEETEEPKEAEQARAWRILKGMEE